jgi:hypothetical protein
VMDDNDSMDELRGASRLSAFPKAFRSIWWRFFVFSRNETARLETTPKTAKGKPTAGAFYVELVLENGIQNALSFFF